MILLCVSVLASSIFDVIVISCEGKKIVTII